jgi:two-component system sensor histidine kinase KdpD
MGVLGEPGRKSPDDILRDLAAHDHRQGRGRLKVFLGYASGVGKSFRMLDEARRRRERGQDVVIGAVQPRVPADVQRLLNLIEVIPLRDGTAIDVDAVLRRHPEICFIDGLAYENPPGSRNPARWQDVGELLEAGIDVVGSINIQYIDEMRDRVEAITGKKVSATVPTAFVHTADEIEIVDAPAIDPSPQTLMLRELALILAADVVDRELEDYLARHGVALRPGTQERILVCVTPRSNVQAMVETARYIAERFHAELIAAFVSQPSLSQADQKALEARLAVARAAGARIEILEGEDPVSAIVDFADARGITQLFIGHSQRSTLRARLFGNPVDRLIDRSRGMDVRIFPQ